MVQLLVVHGPAGAAAAAAASAGAGGRSQQLYATIEHLDVKVENDSLGLGFHRLSLLW